MREYKVRSTYTRSSSARRRAADIIAVIIISVMLVFLLFRLVLVPVRVYQPGVVGINDGELLLVDRLSRFIIEYSIGDIVITGKGSYPSFFRVAAGPGSTYTVRGGEAYLDGALLDESGFSEGWDPSLDLEISVPKGHMLLLPDDRTGIVSLEEYVYDYRLIRGEVRFRVAPISNLAFFY